MLADNERQLTQSGLLLYFIIPFLSHIPFSLIFILQLFVLVTFHREDLQVK